MSENISEGGVGRGGVVRRGRGRQGDDNDCNNCDRGPDARAYSCAVHAAARSHRSGGAPDYMSLLNYLTDLLGCGNVEVGIGGGGTRVV